MIARNIRAAIVTIALVSAFAAPAMAAHNNVCPGSVPPGMTIGASAAKYDVATSQGLTAMAPDGKAFFTAFGYVYTTRGAGTYIEDRQVGRITPISGSDAATIGRALARMPKQFPGTTLSEGAKAIVSRGWSVVIFSCNP